MRLGALFLNPSLLLGLRMLLTCDSSYGAPRVQGCFSSIFSEDWCMLFQAFYLRCPHWLGLGPW